MYGTPWNGSRNMAFSSNKDKLIDKWDLIPKKREDSNAPEVDILITHMPPYKLMDYASNEKHWGCRELRRISRHEVKPYVHIFGHVHEGHGYKKKGSSYFYSFAHFKRMEHL
jgi:Icc-related predicted phosphoesterase